MSCAVEPSVGSARYRAAVAGLADAASAAAVELAESAHPTSATVRHASHRILRARAAVIVDFRRLQRRLAETAAPRPRRGDREEPPPDSPVAPDGGDDEADA